jgi:hypothetical protein
VRQRSFELVFIIGVGTNLKFGEPKDIKLRAKCARSFDHAHFFSSPRSRLCDSEENEQCYISQVEHIFSGLFMKYLVLTHLSLCLCIGLPLKYVTVDRL